MTDLRLRTDDADVLTRDGRIVRLRDINAEDENQLSALHAQLADQSLYQRFFNANHEYAQRFASTLARPNDKAHHAVGAFSGTRLVGVAEYDVLAECTAEFALVVADAWHKTGLGTLLIEHLIAEARDAGISRFVAQVLSSNPAMFSLMRQLGFDVVSSHDGPETTVQLALDLDQQVIDGISAREQVAGAASLRPLLRPTSIAVIGAGRAPGTIGHEVLASIVRNGFTGTVLAVNPSATSILGVPSYASANDLPITPDLAVLALPATQVADAIHACGERGVRAAVLISAGIAEDDASNAELQRSVVSIAREYDMRLVGPNSIGVINTDPTVRLNATFGSLSRRAGSLGVFAQSGAGGAAVLEAADAAGVGLAQFVSIGDKADVGGNDLLLVWAHDPNVRVIGAYLESVGDPRRFARIARTVSAHKPIIVLKAGSTEASQAGQSRTASLSDIAIDALFRRAGVIRVRSMNELMNSARVLIAQPLPAGPRLAVVGNSGGAGMLAATAATAHGLKVAAFDPETAARLVALGVPAENPLDLGATAKPSIVGGVLTILADSANIDAVMTVLTNVAANDAGAVREALCEVAARADKPFIAVSGGPADTTWPLPGSTHALPVFTLPEPAAAALGTMLRYARIASQSRLDAGLDRPKDIDSVAALAVAQQAVAEDRDWLNPDEVFRMLAAFGVSAADPSPDGAHAMVTRDRTAEWIVGSVRDAQCGPMVMLGAGGTLTDGPGERNFALAPLSEQDAEQLIGSVRASLLLNGYRTAPMIKDAAIRDVLRRIALLVDEVPQIAELEIKPLVASQGSSFGLCVLDARIRVCEAPSHPDPLVRQLRAR